MLKLAGALALAALVLPGPYSGKAARAAEPSGKPQAAGPGYPARPVRIIVPFAPGGSDVPARMLAVKLGEKVGQPFVVENRPGAAGVLGAELGAKAAADGYTLTFVTASFAVTAVTHKKLPYDPVKDFAAIGSVGSVPFVLVTHPSLPVHSVRQFVALAKARPGELNYGSPGAGGIGHLANVLLAMRTGVKATHVAYKGTGPAVTALLSGEIQFMMPNLIGALPHVRAGKLRALGVATAHRSPLAPEIPTIAEAGVPGIVVGTWYGLLAPRGTPPAAIQMLNQEIAAVLKSSEFRDQLAVQGVVPEIMAPDEFSAFIRAEIERWGKVSRDAGISESD